MIDLLSLPEKHIPFGYYCYTDTNTPCPFWEIKKGEYPEHEDGYCHYLNKSDWDLNEEGGPSKVIYVNGELVEQTMEEVFGDDEIDPVSGKKIHFASSLIWDQVKECNINMQEPDETVIVQYDTETNETTTTTVGELRKNEK